MQSTIKSGRFVSPDSRGDRRLFLMTKPAVPGRVKTRLVGELSPAQTAELHKAFLADVCRTALQGAFELSLAWALLDEEPIPSGVGETTIPGTRQEGADLGERLLTILAAGAESGAGVAALGSDHPEVTVEDLNAAFEKLESGADVVLGPTHDGGYFLIALRPSAVRAELFRGIPWSTKDVCRVTIERCHALGLKVELLEEGHDIDYPEDLAALVERLKEGTSPCPATRDLLIRWQRMPKETE